LRIIVLEVNI